VEKEAALLEAILYLETEPIDEGALSRISGLGKEAVLKALETLQTKYAKEDSGIELSRVGGGITVSPKKEYWESLRERYGKKNDNRFSRAAMETLSIIAYSQPITRGEIKDIRGTDPDSMIKMLLEKNLIREMGKKDIPGKPTQYGTTREFLRFFRLESIADLPKLTESEAERFELE
jgi:segregation and condensation protein B